MANNWLTRFSAPLSTILPVTIHILRQHIWGAFSDPPTQYISSTEQKHEYSSEQQQKLSFFDPTHPVLFLTYCKDGLQLQCNAVQCTVWTLESCLYFLNSHSDKNWNKNLFEKDIKAFEGFENLDYYFLIAIWNSTEIVDPLL